MERRVERSDRQHGEKSSMKTERRHELQTNKLSDWLGHEIEQLRPHGKKLLAVGILGAVVVIAIAIFAKDRQSAAAQARNDFYLALAERDRDALENVAKTHAGTVVALWAKQAQADLDLINGLSALYINRDEAFQSLDDAKKGYTEVISGASNSPELLRHSLFGLAQTNEATSNLDKAREFYERVIRQFPDSPMAAESRARLEALKDPQIEKWYAWFARQKPKPRSSLPSMPGFPGMPDDLSTLPGSPNLPPLTVPTDSTVPAAPTSPVSPDVKSEVPAEPSAAPLAPATTSPEPKPDSPPATKPEAPATTDAGAKPVTDGKPTTETKPDSASPSATAPPADSKAKDSKAKDLSPLPPTTPSGTPPSS